MLEDKVLRFAKGPVVMNRFVPCMYVNVKHTLEAMNVYGQNNFVMHICYFCICADACYIAFVSVFLFGVKFS